MISDVSVLRKFSKIRGGCFSEKKALAVVPRVRSYAQEQHPK